MRLFGGILPFIGWQVVNVDNYGEPCNPPSHWKAKAWHIEWFGVGAIIFIGRVYAASSDS